MRGQKQKTRKRRKGFGNRTPRKRPVRHHPSPDPIAHNGLLAYMELHLEAILVTGYSPKTMTTRRTSIRRFIAWCDERGLKHPTEITKQVLERFQRHLFYYRKPESGKPLTWGSQFQHLAALKLWFKWLARENHILYNPASEIVLPRQSEHLPRVILNVSEVESIIAEADIKTPDGLRDRALLELLYSTGLRRMEAAGLSLYDVDFVRRLVMVREGKGRKDRVVPIGERALMWLDKYMVEARPRLMVGEFEALFINDYGEPLTADRVSRIVHNYLEQAGIMKPGAAHLLRHACATHMLEGGADIRFIQAFLGHADLNTTEVYTHVAIGKLQAIHDATHPARLQRRDATKTGDES